MKINLFSIIIVLISLSACSPQLYKFQMYQLQIIKSISENKSDTVMEFENSELLVKYDFWTNNGYSNYKIFNKTDSIIYMNMELSHFVVNNYAMSYYSNSTNSVINTNTLQGTFYSDSRSVIKTEGNSVVVILPPKTYKEISGFKVSAKFLHCDFKENSDGVTKIFDIKNTPSRFCNLIYYSFDKQLNYKLMKNDFWISEIRLISDKNFIDHVYPVECGKESIIQREYYKYRAKNKFYFRF